MAITLKKLDLISTQKNAKIFQEISSDIKLAQKRLDDMLAAIDSNTMEYNNGKISKELFEENDTKLRKDSAKIVKKINSSVDTGMKLLGKIIKQMEMQSIEVPKQQKPKLRIKEKLFRKKR